jgi:nitrate reductase gamma subunit
MNSEMLESLKVWSQFGHPLVMWGLFALSLYAMYLGFQARSIRSVEAEVRKELIQKDVRTKHYLMGSILLALMVVGCIGGMAVTYINNGKLFVGPHLIVGLSMTGIIAIAAALSPLMQKGNDLARYTHIVLNIVLVGLFGWQAVTGMDIVQRIISKL